jgi:hypothetical protein
MGILKILKWISALFTGRIHLLLRCDSSFSICCVHRFVGEVVKMHAVLGVIHQSSRQEAHSHEC